MKQGLPRPAHALGQVFLLERDAGLMCRILGYLGEPIDLDNDEFSRRN